MIEDRHKAIQLVTASLAWKARWDELGAEPSMPPEYRLYLDLLQEIDEQGRAIQVLREMTAFMAATCQVHADEIDEDPQEWWQGMATELAAREDDEPKDS
jgi:hypothetical protein